MRSQNIKVISAGLRKRKAVFTLVQINTQVWKVLTLNLIKTMEILVFAKLNCKSGGKSHLARFWEHHVAGWTENTIFIAASCFFRILWVSLKRERKKKLPQKFRNIKKANVSFSNPYKWGVWFWLYLEFHLTFYSSLF